VCDRVSVCQYELLFCVDDSSDAAVMVVNSLIQKYPQVNARLFAGGSLTSLSVCPSVALRCIRRLLGNPVTYFDLWPFNPQKDRDLSTAMSYYCAQFSVILIFTARHYASAVYAMALCLSVTSRCSTKTAKHRITQTKPHDSSSFVMPKIFAKFDLGHPLRGRQMQAGWVTFDK